MAVDEIDDLFAQPTWNDGELTLSWSAPDGGGGAACDSYTVKRDNDPILDAGDWAAATTIAQSITPQLPGNSESLTVSGLTASDSYWFAVRGTRGVEEGDIGRIAIGSAGGSPAFPGAFGSGSLADAGRSGWTVIKVTNLNNSGAGSLRTALTTNTPRIIIFEVAGTIALASKITMYYDDCYIAGETAFRNGGEGITIRNWAVSFRCQNIICRYIRFRSGDGRAGARTDAAEVQNNGHALELFQPFGGSGSISKRMIFDHCSFSWGDDETVQLWVTDVDIYGRIKEVTIQSSIIAEGMKLTIALDGFDNQGKGSLHGTTSDGVAVETISYHKCLFIKNERRNPRTKGGWQSIDNCIFYANGQGTYVAFENATDLPTKTNLRKNYQPPTSGDTNDLMITITDDSTNWARDHKVMPDDNIGNYRFLISDDDYDVVGEDSGNNPASVNNPQWETEDIFSLPGIIPDLDSRDNVYDLLITQKAIGATIQFVDSVIDDVDDRLIDYVINTSEYGGYPNTTAAVGGYPAIANMSGVPTDTSGDGIPDAWKTAKGLVVAADNANTFTLHGKYTDLEVYLHELTAVDVITSTVTVTA